MPAGVVEVVFGDAEPEPSDEGEAEPESPEDEPEPESLEDFFSLEDCFSPDAASPEPEPASSFFDPSWASFSRWRFFVP